MLGCKFRCNRDLSDAIGELIDTCWDVNARKTSTVSGIKTELIDTCWDVNIIQCTGGLEEYTELIDTCWDVNNREQIITVIMIAN